MKINEIFLSLQGEGTRAGLPCVFIRTTGCNLRCSYCDTKYSYEEGKEMSPLEILMNVASYSCRLVEITGGEPLIQEDLNKLIEVLLNEGFEVLVETNGSKDIGNILRGAIIIMDIKTPSSGMAKKMLWKNISYLTETDELKFVIQNRKDYEFTKKIYRKYRPLAKVLLSPVFGKIKPKRIVEWILEDELDVRFQIQLHKIIWDKSKRGV